MGIAHHSNLISYFVTQQGVQLQYLYERRNLFDGLLYFANIADLKVINISLGYFTYNSTIWDALVYANSKGKLIACAGGSADAYFGVYPAKHSNTIAATGVLYKPTTDPKGLSLEDFGLNYRGEYIDFSVYLKRSNDSKYALGMHSSSFDHIEAKGSSSGAAMVTGIASIIWEQNPSFTKDEVINYLKNAASIYRYKGGSRDDKFGWEVIDAKKAVIDAKYGFLTAYLTGVNSITRTGTFTWNGNY